MNGTLSKLKAKKRSTQQFVKDLQEQFKSGLITEATYRSLKRKNLAQIDDIDVEIRDNR